METILDWLNRAMSLEGIWHDIVVAACIVALSVLARGIFTRYIFRLVLNMTKKTKTDLDEDILLAFEGPLKALISFTGLFLAVQYLPLAEPYQELALSFWRSFLIVFAAWGLYNLAGSSVFTGLAERMQVDRVLIVFAAKVFRFVIIALAASIIAGEWNYDVNGFLAGLGLGGLAFALAAQDAVSNIFGGVVIIMDKPFSVGDWIETPSVEGTVEEMTFRSTKVRTFANALVTVPNSIVANEPVTNWTRMGKRRITFHLGVPYTTPREKLKKCVEQIRAMLENHPEIHQETIFVRFDQFSESSLAIFLYFFTRTTVWAEYLKVKEDVNFKIMEILEREGVSVALPSRSIYFETPLPDSAAAGRR